MNQILRRPLVMALLACPFATVAMAKSRQRTSLQAVPGVDALIMFHSRSAAISPSEDAKLRALITPGAAYRVVGRNDGSFVPGLSLARAAAIKERLVIHGADVDAVLVTEAEARELNALRHASDVIVQPPVPAQPDPWPIQAGDSSLKLVLQRWATSSGWQVVWEKSGDIPFTRPAQPLQGGFIDVAGQLIQKAKTMGHRVDAEAFSNNVLVIR